MHHGNGKKDLIRRAAVKVIAERGYPLATTDKIAAEAGVAVGTIYNYFKNKEEMIAGIFEGEYQKRNSFYKIIEQMELEPLDKIRSVVEMHFTGFDHHPELYRVITLEKDFYLRTISAEDAPDDGLRNFIIGVLDSGISAKKIKECDTEVVASIICGALERVIADLLNKKIADVENGVEEIMATIRAGIALS